MLLVNMSRCHTTLNNMTIGTLRPSQSRILTHILKSLQCLMLVVTC